MKVHGEAAYSLHILWERVCFSKVYFWEGFIFHTFFTPGKGVFFILIIRSMKGREKLVFHFKVDFTLGKGSVFYYFTPEERFSFQ